MNKKIYLGFAFLLVGIMIIGNVLAFAVSSKYWEDNPLIINPGETKHAFIVLQNLAGTEDVSATVGILQGSEIAVLDEPGKVYEIPLGQRVEVPFTVTIPTSGSVVGISNIIFDVSTITNQQEGPMSLGSGAQKLIPVLIEAPAAPEKKSSGWIFYLVVGVLLLALVALAIVKAKKK